VELVIHPFSLFAADRSKPHDKKDFCYRTGYNGHVLTGCTICFTSYVIHKNKPNAICQSCPNCSVKYGLGITEQRSRIGPCSSKGEVHPRTGQEGP